MATLHAFRALWPSSRGGRSAAEFLLCEPADPETPYALRLSEVDRRETDRSRFVAHMRAASLLAAWRREGVFEGGHEPMLFAWRLHDEVLALAGLVASTHVPRANPKPTEIREAKARLEALGVVLEFPILAARSLPPLDVRSLYDTSQGSLCSVLGLAQATVELAADEMSGSEVAGALDLILQSRAEEERGIPVWIRSATHDFYPPIGALLWPWVEELAGAPR